MMIGGMTIARDIMIMTAMTMIVTLIYFSVAYYIVDFTIEIFIVAMIVLLVSMYYGRSS